MARVRIIYEVPERQSAEDWSLCFQWCEYIYKNEDIDSEFGYRFIWRRENGKLQPARGQARIPKVDDIENLMKLAEKAGWLKTVEKSTNNK